MTAPYESPNDPSRHEKERREQVYNSFWNGNLLGYPERFIESYCREFHNDVIDIMTKEEEMQRASDNLRAAYDSNGMKPVLIKLGMDSNLLSEIRKLDVI